MRTVAKARLQQLQAQGVASAQLYGENAYGGLHALFLLTDKPEAYKLPSTANAVLPSRNNFKGYLGSLVTGLLAVVGAVVAFRQRGEG
jgi:formate dehydrogenase iron-sulfur subunit